MQEKKEKSKNPGFAGFIANTYQIALDAVKSTIDKVIPGQPKVLKEQQKVDPKPAEPAEKVPDHAKLVLDDEKLTKEITDLKLKLRTLYK